MASLPRERLFVAFAGHWRGRPYVDRLQVVSARDERQLERDLRLGRLDVAVGTGDRPLLPTLLLLALDRRSPAFADAAVRARVGQTIDREALARRLLTHAEAWTRLLLSDRPPGSSALPTPSPPATPERGLSSRPVTLAVDRRIPPLISQRIVAHLATLGFSTEVQALDPSRVRTARADARLLVFVPEVASDPLALCELRALAQTGLDKATASCAGTEDSVDPEGLLLPLARQSATAAFSASVQGSGPHLRLEDTWLPP
jgi:hypothetical protein